MIHIKTLTTSLLLLSFSGLVFAQDKQEKILAFQVQGIYNKSIKQEQLQEAQTMRDINPGFPESYMEDKEYLSAAILVSHEGEVTRAQGSNHVLTTEQKCILDRAPIGSNIGVEVKYLSENVVTRKLEPSTMKFSVTIVPEVQAQYPQGFDQLDAYFKEQIIDKIPYETAEKIELATVKFKINEAGKASDVEITQASNFDYVDKLVLDALARMPRWIPAVNIAGQKVKQSFEFRMGIAMGC